MPTLNIAAELVALIELLDTEIAQPIEAADKLERRYLEGLNDGISMGRRQAVTRLRGLLRHIESAGLAGDMREREG